MAIASLIGKNATDVAQFLLSQFESNAEAINELAELATETDQKVLMTGLIAIAKSHQLSYRFVEAGNLATTTPPVSSEQSSATMLAAVSVVNFTRVVHDLNSLTDVIGNFWRIIEDGKIRRGPRYFLD